MTVVSPESAPIHLYLSPRLHSLGSLDIGADTEDLISDLLQCGMCVHTQKKQ